MQYLDRQNVAAARLKGLQRDLNLDGLQYSNVINLFFVTYIAVQVRVSYSIYFQSLRPAQLILNRFPHLTHSPLSNTQHIT